MDRLKLFLGTPTPIWQFDCSGMETRVDPGKCYLMGVQQQFEEIKELGTEFASAYFTAFSENVLIWRQV
jgi:hypothetical protein